MTKLCARGKAAAKSKFKVYPSAYANAYASKICAGKAKDPSGVKRKDWGPKKMKGGGKVMSAYTGRAVRQPTETDKEFAMRHEYHTPFGKPDKQKPVKAVLGIMMAKNVLERSQGARDIAGSMGLLPRLASDKFQKKADEKSEQERREREQAQLKAGPQQMQSGGMMRGSGAAIRGTKFKGVF